MHRLRLFFLSLLIAVPALAQSTPIALVGTLVTPQEVIPHGVVVMQHGQIVASGADVKPPSGATIVAVDGVIAPGFIDLHNHLAFNVVPRWKPIQEFGARYEWQQKPVQQVTMAPVRGLTELGLSCESERYAEVKAITEGETSVTGGLQQPCSNGLARNLDYDPELPGAKLGKIIYNVFPFQMSEEQLAAAKAALAATPRGSLLIHVAEGSPNSGSATREFQMLKARGLLLPGVSMIHAVGLRAEDFDEAAKAGVGFVWSPRSNIELYGDTARVAAAKASGIHMALAPDWSPTGSDGTLAELNYASLWNTTQHPSVFTERELVLMVTANPAEMVGMGDQIGSLAAGHVADVIVVKKTGEDPYWSLTHAMAPDVELVFIGGKPIYGDPKLMKAAGATHAEPLEVCAVPKAIQVEGKSWASTSGTLTEAMNKFGRKLAPLSECGD